MVPLIILFIAVMFLFRTIQRSDGWIEMPEFLFWEFVGKHAPAGVFVVLRGTFLKQSCHVFAHQGIVLFTRSRTTHLPAGVTETLTFELQET